MSTEQPTEKELLKTVLEPLLCWSIAQKWRESNNNNS